MNNPKHGEGCGCYYCVGPRPGISPPPTEEEMREMERAVEREWGDT